MRIERRAHASSFESSSSSLSSSSSSSSLRGYYASRTCAKFNQTDPHQTKKLLFCIKSVDFDRMETMHGRDMRFCWYRLCFNETFQREKKCFESVRVFCIGGWTMSFGATERTLLFGGIRSIYKFYSSSIILFFNENDVHTKKTTKKKKHTT